MAIKETGQGFFSSSGVIYADSLKASSLISRSHSKSKDPLTESASSNIAPANSMDAAVLEIKARYQGNSTNQGATTQTKSNPKPIIGGTYQNELIAASKKILAEKAKNENTLTLPEQAASTSGNTSVTSPHTEENETVERLIKARDQELETASRLAHGVQTLKQAAMIMDRMRELAGSARPGQSLTQRQANEAEFKQLKQDLQKLAENSANEGDTFMRGLDPKSLGLDETRLTPGRSTKNVERLSKIREEIDNRTTEAKAQEETVRERAAVLDEAINTLNKPT